MERPTSPPGVAVYALAAALAGLTQVGCTLNRVEMPQAKGAAVAPAARGSIRYAEARCFLYLRGDAQPGILHTLFATPEWAKASERGLRCGRPDGNGPAPLLARTLVLGESLGFRRDNSGRLVAVAGEEHIPLDEGRYGWEVVPTKYTSEQRSAQIVGGLIVGALGAGMR